MGDQWEALGLAVGTVAGFLKKHPELSWEQARARVQKRVQKAAWEKRLAGKVVWDSRVKGTAVRAWKGGRR